MSIKYDGIAKGNYTRRACWGEKRMLNNLNELEEIILNEQYTEMQLWYEDGNSCIDEVFDNDISNSIEFTGEGHIRLNIYKKGQLVVDFTITDDLSVLKTIDSDVVIFTINDGEKKLGVRLLI